MTQPHKLILKKKVNFNITLLVFVGTDVEYHINCILRVLNNYLFRHNNVDTIFFTLLSHKGTKISTIIYQMDSKSKGENNITYLQIN
jgi:hypothetical protein